MSSQFKLKSNISDSLASRVGIVILLPFTMEELNDALLLPSDSYDVFFKAFTWEMSALILMMFSMFPGRIWEKKNLSSE